MNPRMLGWAALAGALVLIGHVGGGDADAQTLRERAASAAQYSVGGTEQCLRCHAGESMTVVGETPHGNLENPHSPYSQQGCESCHGPGALHSSRAGGGVGQPLLIAFEGFDDVKEQNAACMNCHAETMGDLEGFAWVGSLHETADMTCQDCHQSHSNERAMRDPELQRDNCSGCHRRQIARHPRFEGRGIEFDELECSACHWVHELEPED